MFPKWARSAFALFKMNKSNTWLHSSFSFFLTHFHLQRMQKVRNYKGKYRKLEVKPGSYVKNKENKTPNRLTHNEFQHKHLLYRQLLKILKVWFRFCNNTNTAIKWVMLIFWFPSVIQQLRFHYTVVY